MTGQQIRPDQTPAVPWLPLAVEVLAMERYRPGSDPTTDAVAWSTCREQATSDLENLLPLIRLWLSEELDTAAGEVMRDAVSFDNAFVKGMSVGLAQAARIVRQQTEATEIAAALVVDQDTPT